LYFNVMDNFNEYISCARRVTKFWPFFSHENVNFKAYETINFFFWWQKKLPNDNIVSNSLQKNSFFSPKKKLPLLFSRNISPLILSMDYNFNYRIQKCCQLRWNLFEFV
jgi:hypothetical protein